MFLCRKITIFAPYVLLTTHCVKIFSEAEMSNVKHPKCAIRTKANEAKARLVKNNYAEQNAIPKNITAEQQVIYFKMKKMKNEGIALTNPVVQLGDAKTLATLSHEEKQRYIINLCADYVKVKSIIDGEVG